MKKLVLSVFLIVCMLLVSTCGAYAAAPAASTAISTVLIDGNITKLNPMPQIINKEVYFPLGSALTVVGVKANTKNVIVGKANANITVVKGNLKFYAKLNSKAVTINGKTVQLKAPVIAQKNVMYIPGELIGKFIGKKVLYSSELKTVSIISESQYKTTKAFFDQLDKVMTQINDYKYKMTMDMDMNFDIGITAKYGMSVNGEVDAANKISHALTKTSTEALGQSQETEAESYTVDEKTYTKDAEAEKWIESVSGDFGASLLKGLTTDSEESSKDPGYEDVISSSCKISTDKSGKTTQIKSSILASVLAEDSLKDLFEGGAPTTFDLILEVDNATKMLSGMKMNFSGNMISEGMKVNFTAVFQISIFDYNKGVTIQLPEGIN